MLPMLPIEPPPFSSRDLLNVALLAVVSIDTYFILADSIFRHSLLLSRGGPQIGDRDCQDRIREGSRLIVYLTIT